MKIFNYGGDELRNWQTATAGTFAGMLVQSGSFDRDNHFVSSVIADVVTVAGYGPLDLTSLLRTPDTANDWIAYTADRPDFGSLAAGQDAVAFIVYKRALATVDVDATSILIGWDDLDTGSGPPDTGDIDPFKIIYPSDMLFKVRAASGS